MEQCRILFVCSANLCRSVTAATLARRIADEHPSKHMKWLFESAGTDVHPHNSLPRDVERAMADLDLPVRHRAQAVNGPLVRSADLILTAERDHRTALARPYPFTVQYTFTLLQFARLIEAGRDATGDDEIRSRHHLFDLTRLGRACVPPGGADDDIPDPVAARSRRAMHDCATTTEHALRSFLI